MKRFSPGWPAFGLTFALLLAVDLLSKIWAIGALDGRAPIGVIPGLISLQLTYNPGAAFSLGASYTYFLTAFSLAIVAAGLRYATRFSTPAWGVSAGLFLGGAAGNLIDRLFRAPSFGRGHVVDFIYYHGLFVGNIADIALVVGVGLGLILYVKNVAMLAPAREG